MYSRKLVVLLVAFAALFGATNADSPLQWVNFGRDLSSTRSITSNSGISIDNVANLHLKWNTTFDGDIVGTPTVTASRVYVTDFGCKLTALKRQTGEKIWSVWLPSLTNEPKSCSRNSPVIAGDSLIIGDYVRAYLIKVSIHDGSLQWATRLDTHPYSGITQHPVVAGDLVYVGVSSQENAQAYVDNGISYPCCSSRGSIAAVDFRSGDIVWQRFTIPDEKRGLGKYSGATVWGGQPSVDDEAVYVGTGQLYQAPQSAKDCQARNNATHNVECVDHDVYFNSALKLNRFTGEVMWSFRPKSWDVWTLICGLNGIFPRIPSLCPTGPNDDYDLSTGVTLIGPYAVVGSKSGTLYTLNRQTGALISTVQHGRPSPSSTWGMSVHHDKRANKYYAFINDANGNKELHQLVGGKNTTGGCWSKINIETGEIVWQTANPIGTNANAPTAYVNGVVFAGSFDNVYGALFGLDAANGEVVWRFNTGASVFGGVSVSHKQLFSGYGYKRLKGNAGNALLCFEL